MFSLREYQVRLIVIKCACKRLWKLSFKPTWFNASGHTLLKTIPYPIEEMAFCIKDFVELKILVIGLLLEMP